ncbi:MAG: AmmeMemoRadiSam system protein B [Candidatus Melainabacteria bacterium]|nr:MAG: AmmeMemoRadiSam system protein B [Candidatus Melainabacteria bacterium]
MNNFISRAGLNFSQKRQAAFAGTWYESDPKKLRAQIDSFLSSAQAALVTRPVETGFSQNLEPTAPILAIVSPHAGYMFSGSTAAFAYEQARRQRPKRIFLLGPSHYVGFEGAVLPTDSIFATPLGDLLVDKDVTEELSDFPLFRQSSQVHKREHSLEMQLPFIRATFGDVKIVPIIIGSLPDEMDVQLMGQILRRYLQPDDLVVVSSDFTHYGPRYEYQPFESDWKEGVRRLDAEAFAHLSKHDVHGFLDFKERTADTICGFYPCAVLSAMLPETAYGSALQYRTSQDAIVEDDNNSVSYLALAFSDSRKLGWEPLQHIGSERDSSLPDSVKDNLLALARLTLERAVTENRRPSESEIQFAVNDFTKTKMGAFVTLYRVDPEKTDQKELRGCIGYIWPVKPLFQTVIDNTIGSSSRDYRFQPVSKSELKELEIDINVLTAPHRVNSYKDIVVGRDGVVLYKNGRQSVFLPSVATEFGWDLSELLTQLSLKAGLPADAWQHGARFDVFQSQSISERE